MVVGQGQAGKVKWIIDRNMAVIVGLILLGQLEDVWRSMGDGIKGVGDAIAIGYLLGEELHKVRVSHPRGSVGEQNGRSIRIQGNVKSA